MSNPQNLSKSSLEVDELLRERKAWKRKETLEKLKQERKQIEANCLKNVDAAVDALQRFPTEVWEKLFDLIKEPHDLDSLWRTSSTFQQVLKKRRIGDILMPMVIREVDESHFYQLRKDLKLEEVSKKLTTIADERDFEINLEQVRKEKLSCRSWDEDLKLSIDKVSGYPNFKTVLKNSKCFSSQRIRTFVADISYTDYIRKSYVEENEIKNRMELCHSRITKLMEAVGEQIWKFDLTATGLQWADPENGMHLTKIYDNIRNWLSLMPNLKWLYLEGFFCKGQVAEELKASMIIDPIPKLASVEGLEIFVFSYNLNEDVFTDHILQLCPNLKHLGIQSHDEVIEDYDDAEDTDGEGEDERGDVAREAYKIRCKNYFEKFVYPFKLESLSFTTAGHQYLGSELETLLQPNWNLKKICLRLKGLAEVEKKKLIGLLEKFPTLEDVCIEASLMMMVVHKDGEEFAQLQLPNVTRFDIRFTWPSHNSFMLTMINDYLKKKGHGGAFFKSLDFLLPMKKLEEVLWRNYSHLDPTGNEVGEEFEEDKDAKKFLKFLKSEDDSDEDFEADEEDEEVDSQEENEVAEVESAENVGDEIKSEGNAQVVEEADGSDEEAESGESAGCEIDKLEETEIIQFQGGKMDMYKSNVWSIFPNLKRLTVVRKMKKTQKEEDCYDDEEDDLTFLARWNEDEIVYEREKVCHSS